MKFAALALIGAVSAKRFEEDLTENIRVHYPASTVKKFMELEKQLVQEGMATVADFEKEHPDFEKNMK
jgi:hypothetical protein